MSNKVYVLTAADFDGYTSLICVFREKPTFYSMCQKVTSHLGWDHEEDMETVEKAVEEILSRVDNNKIVSGPLYSTDSICLTITDMVE